MEDSRQIENLIYRYAEHIDEGNLAEVAELFRDAELTPSRLARRLGDPARTVSQAINQATGLNVS